MFDAAAADRFLARRGLRVEGRLFHGQVDEICRHAALAQLLRDHRRVFRLALQSGRDFLVIVVDLAERGDPVIDALVRQIGQTVGRDGRGGEERENEDKASHSRR